MEIGYSVLPQWRRRGLAGEMVRALVGWAFRQPGVEWIVARTAQDKPASVRVLLGTGLLPDGMEEPPENGLKFRLEKDSVSHIPGK